MTGDLSVWVAHALELAMVAPAAAIALVPVASRLRQPFRRICALTVLTGVLLVICGATLFMGVGCSSNDVLMPGAIVLLVLYALLVDLPLSKKHLCFFLAAMLSAFATLYAIALAVPWEVENARGALLPQSALLSYVAVDAGWRWVAPVPAALTVLICWMVPISLSLMELGRVRVIFLVLMTFVPLIVWLLLHITWWTASRMEEAGRLEREASLLRLDEKRYAELSNYMRQTRELRHDYRQHLHTMASLLEDRNLEGLGAYLGELDRAEQVSHRPQLCANPAVDALASHYDALARERNVTVEWALALGERLPVRESDLCAVLGNLLENALTAVEDLPVERRRVTVRARQVTERALGLTVSNPFEGPVRLGADGLPAKRRDGHGIGLSSVVATAERYGGSVDVRAEEDTFYVGVILYHEPCAS